MKNVFVFGSVLVTVGLATFSANAAVTASKAMELSLHRVERLVILKKIEDSFETKLKSIKLEKLAHSAPDEPSFKSTLFQYPNSDLTQKNIEITMNEDGKVLGFVVSAGSDAEGATDWPDKDSATLLENSLHEVYENGPTVPEIAPFDNDLTQIEISQVKNTAGEDVALIEMKASSTVDKLHLLIKTNGDFDSYKVVKSP